jgi:hypothetical protein
VVAARKTSAAKTAEKDATELQLATSDPNARVSKTARAGKDKDGHLTVPFKGKDFRLAEDVGIMPLMEWAAASDVDVNSPAGLRAVFYVLQDAVHADSWAGFRSHARETKAKAEDVLDFANAALEALAGRPTEASSGSTDGS